ncbi:N-acetylmuramoyl-L-alanine amidase [Nostoc sp. FACHB-87]|uniref:N-acetylmuramoyl-L-alanine amidase n=1 Tax=Nostocaceae TaxID=1162 RepID=UPI00168541C4|nr:MULTISPECIES: N-acetylmuramoyl-L-alanine amidase [Nostocaceae]MBD2458622.1 N-acetylmuramoyl-L-alanine amidase [Nostoc sp. FACHB-87]MBD2479685.1 N-acetylmuramoyl-L-alanine amidase [Anabaena sp. FACHB-83]
MSLIEDLAEAYSQTSIQYPNLKAITLAQWMLESSRGTSKLARENFNFGGLKWRDEMEGFATKIFFDASDGPDTYCKFTSVYAFIRGYWKFLTRAPYTGWEAHTSTPEAFIEFIGPIYAGDPNYISKVKSLLLEAQNLLAKVADGNSIHGTWIKETEKAIYWMEGAFYIDKLEKTLTSDGKEYGVVVTDMKEWFASDNPPRTMKISKGEGQEPEHKPIEHPGTGAEKETKPDKNDQITKPPVEFIASPNFNSGRNGTDISSIIMHNTDGSFQAAINTFLNGTSRNRVSAHYIISRDGKIVQMVKDSDTAWHARSSNQSSIGIEHEADKFHQSFTRQQEKASIALVKYLMKTYNISLANIKPHRDVVNTDCPGWIWPNDTVFEKWKTDNLT